MAKNVSRCSIMNEQSIPPSGGTDLPRPLQNGLLGGPRGSHKCQKTTRADAPAPARMTHAGVFVVRLHVEPVEVGCCASGEHEVVCGAVDEADAV